MWDLKGRKWFLKKHYFFRVTFNKIYCIKINHHWTQISHNTLYEARLKEKLAREIWKWKRRGGKNVWDKREKVVSKETYHIFRVTVTEIHCIKINHCWTRISYDTPNEAHLQKKRLQGRYENENRRRKKCVRFNREKVVSKETCHTSSEWHSLKSTASKLIIFRHG